MTTTSAVTQTPAKSAPPKPSASQARAARRAVAAEIRESERNDRIGAVMPRWLNNTFRTLICLMIVLPLGYIIMASVSADSDVASGKAWPTSWHFDNYVKIWQTVDLGQGLMNSFLVAGSTAVVAAVVSVGLAYVLARYAFRGRLTVMRGLVGLQSIPGTLMLLPIFVLYSSAATYLHINIIGTRWGLFITYLTFALPFATWVMVTYLRGLPRELEEAAIIDGASTVRVLRSIVLPLSWPGIIVSGIFSFLLGWNDVMFSSVMTGPSTQTAAIVLQVFGASQEGGALPLYGQEMAASLICALPVVVLYLAFQKYLVSGLTAGGVK